MIDGNIWSASLRVCRTILPIVLIYVVMVIALRVFSEYRDSGTSPLGVHFVVITLLAIPAHLVMLTANDPATLMQNGMKRLWPFLWRSVVLVFAASLPALLAIMLALGAGLGSIYAAPAFLLVCLPLGCTVFALLGTMLPAATVGDNASFGAALRRAKRSFGYSFSRLLVAFGALSIIQVVVVLLASLGVQLRIQVFPVEGGIDPVALLVLALGASISAYQIVMTAVVLSRSYLRSQRAIPAETA